MLLGLFGATCCLKSSSDTNRRQIVVIQPDPNECDTALLISDSDDDKSIPDEDNDPDFPEPGRRTAQTNFTTYGPQQRKDYRKIIAEFSWVIVSVEFLLNKSLFVSRKTFYNLRLV